MLSNRLSASASDRAAARIFEAWLKRHVHDNPGCQRELDWFVGTLDENIRRSHVLIDQEVKRLVESGQSPCDKFMQELAKPHLDAPHTVGLRLSASGLSLGRAPSPGAWSPGAWSSASSTSSRSHTPAPPDDTRAEELARTNVEAPVVGAGPSTITFPGVGSLQTSADADTKRQVKSPPAASKPLSQEAVILLPPRHIDQPHDGAQAPPQINLQDLFSQTLGDSIPGVEWFPESQQPDHNDHPTEPAPTTPLIQVEFYDPPEPGPVDRGGEDAEADVRGSLFGEASSREMVVTPASVVRVVHPPEPAKEPGRGPPETKTEWLVESEQPVPNFDQAPSSERPRMVLENIPARQSGPQPDILAKPDQVTPQSQPTDEPRLSPERVSVPDQTVEPQPQGEPKLQQIGENKTEERPGMTEIVDGSKHDQPIASPPAPSQPSVQGVPTPATLQLEHVDGPKALSQVNFEDPPRRDSEVRPSRIPLKPEDIPPETQPSDEHVVPGSGIAPAERIPELRQLHENRHTETAPETPRIQVEFYDPYELAVEQGSDSATTAEYVSVLDEVPSEDLAVSPGPETSPAVLGPVHQPRPATESGRVPSGSKTESFVESERVISKPDQALSSTHPQIEAENIPIQQPELQPDTLPKPDQVASQTQRTNEPLSSSEHLSAPSQIVESQLQAKLTQRRTVEGKSEELSGMTEIVDGSEHGQQKGDSSPEIPWSNPELPDSHEAAPNVGSTPAVVEVSAPQPSVVPPVPVSTSAVQQTTHQLELAKKPAHITPEVKPETSFAVQPSQSISVSVSGESVPPIASADSAELGASPSAQPTHGAPVSQPAPNVEPQPSPIPAPRETNLVQEPPNPEPEAHPDAVSGMVVGETQQSVAGPDGLAVELNPVGQPEIQPDSKLSGPEPVKFGVNAVLPGEYASPPPEPKADDHPVSAPVSTFIEEAQSVRAPQDTAILPLRAQPGSFTPPDDPEPPLDPIVTQADQLCEAGGKLAQQFGTYGNIDDLDEAIEAYGRAAELLAPGPDSLAVTSYLNLGRMMRIKFEAFHDIGDLDSAFDDGLLKAHNLLRSSPTNELYHDVLYELGAAYLGRYVYDGTETAGDDAQRYCELALNAQPSPSGPKRAETHCVLSRLYLARFEYFFRTEDATSALQSLDAASDAGPALAEEARYMENRARALFAFYRTSPLDYNGLLDEALGLARQARELTSTVTIQHPIASTLLADLLLARYERLHDQPDLDEALELLETAVRQVPYVRPEQPWIGERLARALIARFVNQGGREDLDDAISFLEIALNLTVTNAYRRRARLDAFGGALTLRFRNLALGEELTGNDRQQLLAGVGSM